MTNFFLRCIAWLSGKPSKTSSAKKAVLDLRMMALKLKADELGITENAAPYKVWGLLMETAYPKGAASLVTFIDGSTSLYFSNGGGIIGAGDCDLVKTASKDFLATADQFLSYAHPVNDFPLPQVGHVTFYLKTFDGVLSCSALELELGENRNVLSPLFYAGQDVISRLREQELLKNSKKP